MSTTKLNKTLNNRKEIPEIPRNRQAIAYPFGILNEKKPYIGIMYPCPIHFIDWEWNFEEKDVWSHLTFAKTFAKQCGIDPLECLKRNIAKLAGCKERGTLTENGDER